MTARTTNPELLEAIAWIRFKAEEETVQAAACVQGRSTPDTILMHRVRGEVMRDIATWLEYNVFKMKASRRFLENKLTKDGDVRKKRGKVTRGRDILQEIADMPEEIS